ncbi:MAG: FimV/HubP family polar landmark protein, partial [Methylococcales bacterium]
MSNVTKTKAIIIVVITTVSMLIPTAAYPLGIGNIKLQSRLNEHLKAEIELLDSANEDLSGLHVNLAPLGKFIEANIPWSYFLKNINIKPVKKANGSILIELSSREVLKEVFLSFILEINWSKGLSYREFTVLLDPPDDYNLSVVSAVPKTKPVIDNMLPFFTTSINKKADKTDKKNGAQYGPIKPSDYIRGIAKKIRYDDVSIEQMVIALFKANPEAFFTDNINALVIKKMLKIPARKEALQLSRKEALEQVNLQNNMWKERTTAKAQVPQIAIDIAKNNSQTPLNNSGTKITKPVSSIPNHGEKANEKQLAGTSSSAEILAILTKLDKLEQKIEVMQNILVSKDRLTISPVSGNEPPVNEKTEPSALSSENLALIAKQDALEKQVAIMQTMLTSKDELIATLQEKNKAITALQVELTPKSVATTKELKKDNAVATEIVITTTFSSIMQELKTNSMLLLQIGSGGIFLGLIGYFLRFKRKKKQEKAEADAINEYLKPLDLAKSSFKNLSVSINDFLSNSHLQGIEVEHSEMDICTEADVYLSYSKYENAESLMRQAIKDYPENFEYKLKLLEVFLASENKTAFASYKRQLASIIQHKDEDFWDRLVKIENEYKTRESMRPKAEESSGENTDANKAANELLDNIQKTAESRRLMRHFRVNELLSDDDTEVKPSAVVSIKPIDNSQTTVDDEIIVDMYDFDNTEVKPSAVVSIKPIDNS